jgi:hypothetical protein
MKREDITLMAREAGVRFSDEEGPLMADHAEWQRQLFERFAALVAAALRDEMWEKSMKLVAEAVASEREACAALCDARFIGDHNREDMEARRCAAAIRARGNT